MNRFSFQALGFSVLLVTAAVAPAQSADPTKTVTASPSAVPRLENEKPSQQLPALTPEAAKQILTEFQRAQSSELKALEHRNKMELLELKAAHAARQKEWERREKETRHKFFADHTNGPDRRAFIRDFMDRHKTFLQLLVDERNQRTHEQEARYNSLHEDQLSRLKEFQESLKRSERPAARLWPSAG